MRVLVLGSQGMAGHVICDYLSEATEHDVWSTARQDLRAARSFALDVTDSNARLRVLQQVRPHAVINATGLLNQMAEANPLAAIRTNSALPHELVVAGDALGFRVLHISTDCVFSGATGGYTETTPTDGIDVYAKSKSLGEVVRSPHVTVRTSIIGPELKPDGIGLFHWFMRQKGEVQGYARVLWNGVTTLELAKYMAFLLDAPTSGLVHLCHPVPISKHDLLCIMQNEFHKSDVHIHPSTEPVCAKTLVNTRTDVTWATPTYPDMMRELHRFMETHRKGAYSYAE